VIKRGRTLKLTIFLGLLAFFELSCLPLGPESVAPLPEQIPIQQARVDPAFSTTEMKIICLLPFSNARQYDDAYVLYDNLIDRFNSKHPQYKIIPPDEALAKISSAKLADDFNVFLGDYTNTGVANPDFLRKIKGILDVDAVLFGEILAMGPYRYSEKHIGPITGRVWFEDVTVNRVGIRLACYRGKDGRNIWEGKHILSEKAELSILANKLAIIFANYFGSRAY
jgi:hypothetical protein